MRRLFADENFTAHVLSGLVRDCPGVDITLAREVSLEGKDDDDVLQWAADNACIVVTHDLQTIPRFAYQRVAAGLPMLGVIVVPSRFPIGSAIAELSTALQCMEEQEFDNRVVFLPLR